MHPVCQHKYLGPVVQSFVSLTSSLRVILLTVLADSIHNILIFFAEKCEQLLHCKSYSHFFSKKFQHICISLDVNFNKSLTNDIVSFEQLSPGFLLFMLSLSCFFFFFVRMMKWKMTAHYQFERVLFPTIPGHFHCFTWYSPTPPPHPLPHTYIHYTQTHTRTHTHTHSLHPLSIKHFVAFVIVE